MEKYRADRPNPSSSGRGTGAGRERSWRAVVDILRSPAQAALQAFHDLGVTVVPADCRVCEAPLLQLSAVPVCSMCVQRVQPKVLAGCRRCGEAADLEPDFQNLNFEDSRFAAATPAGVECRACRLAAPDFDRAVSFGLYEDELRSLIHLLKFERLPAVANLLGSAMAEAMLHLEPQAGPQLLVIAVPLFGARERQRGYNQSVLLADAALACLRRLRPGWCLKPAHSALVRRRRTESQWVLDPRARRRNLAGAFAVAGDVQGREILLVDDILTSGATARECARVLRQAGAARVWVATLARAQRASAIAGQQAEAQIARWDLDVRDQGRIQTSQTFQQGFQSESQSS